MMQAAVKQLQSSRATLESSYQPTRTNEPSDIVCSKAFNFYSTLFALSSRVKVQMVGRPSVAPSKPSKTPNKTDSAQKRTFRASSFKQLAHSCVSSLSKLSQRSHQAPHLIVLQKQTIVTEKIMFRQVV